MKKIKVLIIATNNFKHDGITNVILNYFRNMDKELIDFDFVVPIKERNIFIDELETAGSKIYSIGNRDKNPFQYIFRLIKLIKENEYDIIHTHGNSSTMVLEMMASKFAGVRVRIPHCHNTKTKYKYLNFILNPIFNLSYSHAFACGKMAGEWLYKKEFLVINNGIDIEKYKFNYETREYIRNELKFQDHIVVGHVGAFNTQKNHLFLIDVFYNLYCINTDYRLVLVGDGELKEDICKKIESLNLKDVVYLIGNSSRVSELLQAMDLIIMPSKYEGLPLTLVEAQAAGLNCFVSDTITREIDLCSMVKFISLENSPKEWAEFINTNLIVNQRCTSIDSLDQYNIKINARKLEQIYLEYLNN